MSAVFLFFGFCSADVVAEMETINDPAGWLAWAGVQLEWLCSWLLVLAMCLFFLWFKEQDLKWHARHRGWRVID